MPTVEEVMTRGVIFIDENATVAEAMRIMTERHVSCLIVRRKDERDVDGIVTRKDIINKSIAVGDDPSVVKVGSIMTKPLMTVNKNMDVMHVARLMARTCVRRFPVRECNQIIGILSNSDIFRAYSFDNVIKEKTKVKK
jgi:CBS domain-containing protein